MAIEPKYPTQMSFVGTETQKRLVQKMADEKKISQAEVFRDAIDAYFGLTDGEDTGTSEDGEAT